jgi:hypothetical protein
MAHLHTVVFVCSVNNPKVLRDIADASNDLIELILIDASHSLGFEIAFALIFFYFKVRVK